MKFFAVSLLVAGALAMPAEVNQRDYDPCPEGGLFGNPSCCSLNLGGIISGSCAAPPETPQSAEEFQATCAALGKTAQCCGLNGILTLSAPCQKPVGVKE